MSGEHRVFGPPGTGKTTFLQTQVDKWAHEVGSDAIGVASFTRAAAAEIASRKLPLQPRQVGTLHSFAYRAIGASDVAEKHVAMFNDEHPGYALSSDDRPDLEDAAAESSVRTEGDKLMAQLEVLRAQCRLPELWPQSVQSFARAWDGWKAENDLLDFTDLIAIAEHDTIAMPGNPSVGLFDEVQDFTPLELRLVRRWALAMDTTLLAGDDDQCIYSFKGSTPDAFLDPPVDDDHKRVLRQSYRVPRAVHRLASTWVAQLSRREPKAYEPRDAEGRVRYFDTATYRVTELLVREVEAYLERTEGTVMVLATCSFMLDPLRQVLKREAIPFHNPYRRKRGDWNPLAPGTDRRRMAIDRVLAYLRPSAEVWGEGSRWYSGDDLRLWTDALRASGDRAVLRRGAKAELVALPGGESVDLDVFDRLWADDDVLVAAVRATMHGDLDWLLDSLLASKVKPYEYPCQVARRRGGALLRERPRVVIGTIHSVKGAEADRVYLFPDLSVPAAQSLDSGRADDLDAVVRQFYVGMTRAREELVIVKEASPFSVSARELLAGKIVR